MTTNKELKHETDLRLEIARLEKRVERLTDERNKFEGENQQLRKEIREYLAELKGKKRN